MKINESSDENKRKLNKRKLWVELVLFYVDVFQDLNILYRAILLPFRNFFFVY
jgi:hypothetical protein